MKKNLGNNKVCEDNLNHETTQLFYDGDASLKRIFKRIANDMKETIHDLWHNKIDVLKSVYKGLLRVLVFIVEIFASFLKFLSNSLDHLATKLHNYEENTEKVHTDMYNKLCVNMFSVLEKYDSFKQQNVIKFWNLYANSENFELCGNNLKECYNHNEKVQIIISKMIENRRKQKFIKNNKHSDKHSDEHSNDSCDGHSDEHSNDSCDGQDIGKEEFMCLFFN